MKKIIRVTTVPLSLGGLLQGQLKYMSDHFEILGISSNGNGKLDDVSKNEGISVIPVEMTRQITPMRDLVAVIKLYKIFKKYKPDIVHSHTPKAGTLSMIAARMANVPYRLHTIAGLPLLEASGSKRKLLDFVENITYKCATKIYPNSKGLKTIIIQNGYTTEDKLEVIANGSSNGIDTTFFDPKLYSQQQNEKLRSDWGIDKDDFVYLFVGRLVKDKGINELIKAFKKISEHDANVKLLLVGVFESELDPVLPETEKEIKINSNIIFTGWQNDVRPFFAISNVLTFPSYREGFPNVVMQAGAMNLPSIVSNINGCNEIIENKANGIIIPAKDEYKLYDAMKELYTNHELYQNMVSNARIIITERYERKYVWQCLLNEYRKLTD